MIRPGILVVAGVLVSGLLARPAGVRAQQPERLPATAVPVDSHTLNPRLGGRLRLRDTSSAASMRLIVSLADRTLSVLQGEDTVFRAPVGVASGFAFVYAGHRWEFRTPRGERRVLRKVTDPVWTPPDWHYAETARNHGLRLARLGARGTTLRGGARLVIRRNAVGIVFPGQDFAELPVDEHIVFDGTLFIPPMGTVNRQIAGDLGRFALDLGEGYMIHGTSNEMSIGRASTHGCIRLGEDDLVWLFEHVPVGARVLIR